MGKPHSITEKIAQIDNIHYISIKWGLSRLFAKIKKGFAFSDFCKKIFFFLFSFFFLLVL